MLVTSAGELLAGNIVLSVISGSNIMAKGV